MDYEQALKFYHNAGKFCHPPGLEAMQKLCAALGNPQDSLRFVHIAGTNGKGSCAAMLASVCRHAGWKTGRYTSPDLLDFAERISIDEVNITHFDIARLTEKIRAVSAALPPLSFFELTTALAFLYFAEQHCDIVILECGLGGLYDATNVIKNTAVSVIMPIGLDHCAQLGSTLSAIAAEKAGILRPGVPAVSAVQNPEASAVIHQKCAALNVPLFEVDINQISIISESLSETGFCYKHFPAVRIPLLGLHQSANAAAVLETATLLDMPLNAIQEGLAHAQWPCRFELVQKNPPFIIDGAHNPQGAAALVQSLHHYFPGEKFCFILGFMADKDVDGVLQQLLPDAAKILCITPDASPRALPGADLARKISTVPAVACESLSAARQLAEESSLPCCACGSLYYVGQLRQMLLGVADGKEL